MSVQTYICHFIVANVLSLYYTILTCLWIIFAIVKRPLTNPWAQKLRLEPPSCLKDPKYGVHKYMKVNNIKLHYLESGDSSKPLMVFVHGYPDFWYTWRHQIVDFNKHYWCIAVDSRGYGDSEKPEDVASYRIELLVKDIRELVQELGRDKFILIGHDWGGLIASAFRDTYPEVLSAVILLSSSSMKTWYEEIWNNTDQRKMSWYVFLNRMPYVIELRLSMYDFEMLDKIFLGLQKDTITKQDVECYKYWFGKPFALTPPVNYYRANFEYYIPEKKRCEKNIPMLVANAAGDLYISRTVLENIKKEYAHIETILVENVSHFMHQEDPAAINKLIRNFLNKHSL